ncbi:hypothetical protein [Pseudomonas putida]|uniref:hypothetical protein n=1 Tax=Pseudomonas putida TaxID=303 RepID=UPI002B242F9D|nr:hypothetical protein [Pseudomonas putida]
MSEIVMSLELDAPATEALKNYRLAKTNFESCEHSSEEGDGLYLALEDSAKVLASHVEARAAETPTAPATIQSDVGPSWCTFLPDVEQWATDIALLAAAELKGPVEAILWPYREKGTSGSEMLSLDLAGREGGDFTVTFGTGRVSATEYQFYNLGASCFEVPDMTEAMSMAAALVGKLSATFTLKNRALR